LSPDGTARLADFGIVHRADGSTTRTAAILGSAHYLSPEQLRGEEATVQSDIYASGAVLYEMLAGCPPFEGPNALAVANQHLHGSLPALPEGTPHTISAATIRALAKEPADRFPDAASFASAIEPDQDVEATTMMPPPAEAGVHTRVDLKPAASRSPGEMVLRRSARKTGLVTLLLGLLIVGGAIAAGRQYWGHELPAYPSAPYALLPVCLALVLLLWWLSVRSWSYTMDGNAAVMKWGLLGHHRFGVPVRFITTLELKQSPIDRVLGVGTVELCARDQHGTERRLIMEDLPHPRESYEELMRLVGRALRARPVMVTDEPSPPSSSPFSS
jgi:membrane protein YdbS with pleckstrin-like domain